MKSLHVSRPLSLTLLGLGLCACIVTFGVLQVGGSPRVTASAAPQSTALAPANGTPLPGANPSSPPVENPTNQNRARHPKLTSPLAELSDVAAQAKARGEKNVPSAPAGLPDDLKGLTTAGLMQIDSDGRVQVYVEVDKVDSGVIDALTAAGVAIQQVATDSHMVQGLVPAASLDAVAGLEAVKDVRLPDYGFVRTGSVTMQADAIVKADWVRQSFGVTGAGVRVGVISDGVRGLAAAQAAGELPDVDIQTCVPTPNFFQTNDPTQSPAGAEGTAMLEIVHDIAPAPRCCLATPAIPRINRACFSMRPRIALPPTLTWLSMISASITLGLTTALVTYQPTQQLT